MGGAFVHRRQDLYRVVIEARSRVGQRRPMRGPQGLAGGGLGHSRPLPGVPVVARSPCRC